MTDIIIDRVKLERLLIIYNEYLQKICPELKLIYIYDENQYKYYMSQVNNNNADENKNTLTYLNNSFDNALCLNYYNNNLEKCISNIQFLSDELNIIEIDSYTKTKYRNKKFNKLLRIIAYIMIYNGCLLNINNEKFEILKSFACNPISVYSLNSIFNLNKKNIKVNISLYDNKINIKKNVNELLNNNNINIKDYIKLLYNKYPNIKMILNIKISKNNYELAFNEMIKLLDIKNISKQIKCIK